MVQLGRTVELVTALVNMGLESLEMVVALVTMLVNLRKTLGMEVALDSMLATALVSVVWALEAVWLLLLVLMRLAQWVTIVALQMQPAILVVPREKEAALPRLLAAEPIMSAMEPPVALVERRAIEWRAKVVARMAK